MTQLTINTKAQAMLSSSKILFQAIQESTFGGAVPETIKPLSFDKRYNSESGKYSDGYGITWFDEMSLFWKQDGTFVPYIGTIAIKCKEIGRELECDWHHLYGITLEGDLILWAS